MREKDRQSTFSEHDPAGQVDRGQDRGGERRRLRPDRTVAPGRRGLSGWCGGPAARRLDDLHLGLTDYQVLRDFDGAPGNERDAKRREASSMLDTALLVGADTLQVPASTNPNCDPARVVEDMHWLASEAGKRGLRIAHEGMAWSTINHSLPWDVVRRVGEPNLGVCVDTFHIFVRRRTAADLDGIPMDRIFLVQLSDLDHGVDLQHVIDTARHHRLLPGQGHFPIESVLRRLREAGYVGPVGVEVFNDELKSQDLKSVAREAMSALRQVWAG
jgi:4-hydroxyphenylpyruvate dioxygenase